MIDLTQTGKKPLTKGWYIFWGGLFFLWLYAYNLPSNPPVYTSENCVHDLAVQYADKNKQIIDSGKYLSDSQLANQLSEYERQKSECYK